jgi:hypothetical protein
VCGHVLIALFEGCSLDRGESGSCSGYVDIKAPLRRGHKYNVQCDSNVCPSSVQTFWTSVSDCIVIEAGAGCPTDVGAVIIMTFDATMHDS